jgi:hypothetical protein
VIEQQKKPRAASPRLTPASSGSEILRNLAAVASRPGAAKTPHVLAAMRAREPLSLAQTEVEEIVDRLSQLDRTWLAQLAIVVKGLPKRQTSAARSVRAALIDRAKRESGFPRDQGDPADVAGWVLAWVARVVGRGPDQRPAPMVALTLIDQNRESYYADALLACLEAWAGVSRKLFDATRYETAVLGLLTAPGAAGARRAKASMALVAHLQRARDVAARDRDEIEQQLARARGQLTDLERSRDARMDREGELVTEVKRLTRQLELAREETTNTTREGEAAARNSIGRIRTSVLAVLDLETEQIRAYIDRRDPNVAGALASLQHIEKLRDDLRGE